MPKYNKLFEIDLDDMDLIESALRRIQNTNEAPEARRISDLLGRLHNQKTFFRPTDGVYVGG